MKKFKIRKPFVRGNVHLNIENKVNQCLRDKKLQKHFLELLPLFSFSNSYIQSTIGALMPVFLLANTGLACAIISSNVADKLRWFDYFTSSFVISVIFYVFSLLNMVKMRDSIFYCIRSNSYNFQKVLEKIEKIYKWYFRNAIISMFVSFITFICGVNKILYP